MNSGTISNLLSDEDIQLIDLLERKGSALAARWRSRQAEREADSMVRPYQAVLHCMIALGFQNSLDVDAELPDDLMPAEYLELFR